VAGSTVVDTTGIAAVTDYIPSDLTITVGAGITLGALQTMLRANNQWLPWDAPQHHTATIGGLLAAGLSGPLRHSAGTPRDWVLGMQTVTGDGRVIKSGGKVVKNVAGYDLHKLHLGALGTLGIIAEVAFKVAPLPQADATLVTECRDIATAHALAYRLRERPYNPSALLIVAAAQSVELWARWQGVPAMVERQLRHARQQAAQWREERSGAWEPLLHTPFGSSQRSQSRIGIAPQHLRSILPLLDGLRPQAALHILPTVGHIRIYDHAPATMVELRPTLLQHNGYVVVEQGEHPERWGPAPAGAAIMHQLRSAWDPAGKLNPGRGFLPRADVPA
ncbi:MAG: hypothetical protein RLZZ297_1820, partial [Chloroflexota bacterium]